MVIMFYFRSGDIILKGGVCMLNFNDEIRAIVLMDELNIVRNNDVKLMEFYFAIQLFEKLSKGKTSEENHFSDPKFLRVIRRFRVDLFRPVGTITAAEVTKVAELCVLFRKNGLFEPRSFFRVFSPWILASVEGFYCVFLKDPGVSMMLATLIFLLKHQGAIRLDMIGDAFSASRVCLKNKEMISFRDDVLKLTAEQFDAAWYAVNFLVLQQKKVKVNGNLSKAIKEYRKHYIPIRKLLTDVWDVKKNRRELKNAVNPWLHLNRDIKAIPVEGGVSVGETLFDKYAFLLKDERPTDIIRAVSYAPSRNDSALECSFLPTLFPSKIADGKRALIINPSPDFLLTWEEDSEKSKIKATFAVRDRTVAGLYKMQFPHRTFVSFSDISTLAAMDYILLICRDLSTETIKEMLFPILTLAREETEIFALLPNALFDSSKPFVKDLLNKTDCEIKNILMLSAAVIK